MAYGTNLSWVQCMLICKCSIPAESCLSCSHTSHTKRQNSILLLFFNTFFNGIVQMGFQWFTYGKWMPAATKSRYPTYGACWVFKCSHNPNSDIDYRIFYVHIDVNACNCTWVCMDTVAEFALKVDSHRGIKPASAACRSDALSIELHPHPKNWLSSCFVI